MEKLLKCPRCNINMEKITKKGITIDKCKKCKGLWLDNGEIEKLLNIK
ncbi:MAG: zf-TFIIB domain-containing protein [Candidatus Nanoarchaeia archaeon]|nr:zf-TFIIB domain-containing protein [Candidatus Nanoarchaeia archaeon]